MMVRALPVASVRFTEHAIDRFQERVRPGLTREEAAAELQRIAVSGDFGISPPVWLQGRAKQAADAYLEVAGIVFPLIEQATPTRQLHATTCLVQGGMSELARASRNEQNRAFRARRRHPKRTGGPREARIDVIDFDDYAATA